MKLKSLNCTFLTDSDILKLNLANVQSTEQLLAYADLESLSRQTKIPLNNLKLVKKFIIGQFSPFPEQANHLLEKCLKRLFTIQFGCKKLDDLCSDGVYSSEISEICGASATGKTQICLNLIVNMFQKYLNQNFSCLYIDSNQNFCIERFVKLLESKFEQISEKILKRTQIINCQNIFQLLETLFKLKKNTSSSSSMSTQNENFIQCPNLLIIDSLSSLFNTLFKNYINNTESLFYLNYIADNLKYLASQYNMSIVVVTNRNSYELNTNNLFVSNYSYWYSVPNLIIQLENVANQTTGQSIISNIEHDLENYHLTSDSEEIDIIENETLREENGEKFRFTKKFKVLKCLRASYSADFVHEQNCYFNINKSGIN
jgi:RecA/RadA recombinase